MTDKKSPKKPNEVAKYLAKIGRKGGLARAALYDKETLTMWAKRGGRPAKKKD